MKSKMLIVTTLVFAHSASANVIEPPLVKIPAGKFQMGSGNGADNEKPIHQVEFED